MQWNYGSNERIDDWDKVEILGKLQRVANIPYTQRAEIITPLINKMLDKKIKPEQLIKSNKNVCFH